MVLSNLRERVFLNILQSNKITLSLPRTSFNSLKPPPEISTNLKNLYLLNLRRNLILEKELSSLLKAFASSNIGVIPLKGPALAKYLYGDLALRLTSCDLDLLVRPEDFLAAEGILKKNGYQACIENSRRDFYLKYSCQLTYRRHTDSIGSFLVELHWGLRGLFTYLNTEKFFADAREINLDGQKLLFLDPEDLFIYLCLTCMTITEFVELRYLYDLYTFLLKSKDTLDWNAVLEKIDYRHRACIYFSLKLIDNFFGLRVKAAFLKRIKPHFLKCLFLSIWINQRNILQRKPAASYSWYWFMTTWHYFAASLLYSSSFFDCIRIIYKKIFLSKAEISVHYHKSYSPFLYLQRILKPATRIFRKANQAALASHL